MNKVNAKKLRQTKWTAIQPQNKEKHFLVSDVEFDEEGNVMRCQLEAIMTKRLFDINWQDLRDSQVWQQGWCQKSFTLYQLNTARLKLDTGSLSRLYLAYLKRSLKSLLCVNEHPFVGKECQCYFYQKRI